MPRLHIQVECADCGASMTPLADVRQPATDMGERGDEHAVSCESCGADIVITDDDIHDAQNLLLVALGEA
jgi:hypothetical protein